MIDRYTHMCQNDWDIKINVVAQQMNNNYVADDCYSLMWKLSGSNFHHYSFNLGVEWQQFLLLDYGGNMSLIAMKTNSKGRKYDSGCNENIVKGGNVSPVAMKTNKKGRKCASNCVESK